MKLLFTNSLKKLLPLAELRNGKVSQVEAFVAETYRQDITYSKFSRLPTQEVKNMLKIPCPVETASHQQSQHKIAIFKRIRHNFNISEQSVCFKCQQKCPVRAIKFTELQRKPKTSNKSALHDFFVYLLSLESVDQAVYSQLRWSAAYKVTTALQIMLMDFRFLSKESLLFRQVFRQLDFQQKEYLNQRKKQKVDPKQAIESALKQRSIKLENSPYE